jgi:nucleoid DNA-binding protein
MRKPELVSFIAAQADIPQYAAAAALTAFTDEITECLSMDGTLSLTGFGSFSVKTVAQRSVRNPQTGQLQITPAHKRVVFRPGKKLRTEITGASNNT